MNGTNAYAILRSPRNPGTEAMVISASWLSRTGDGDGTLNLRGISTVLALAAFLKRKLLCAINDVLFQFFPSHTDYSYWAKDIVFVISDGYLDGMQAWLGAYHGSEQYSKLSCIYHLDNCLAFSRSASRATKSILWRNLDGPQYRLPRSFILTSRGIFRSVSSIQTEFFLMSKISQKRVSTDAYQTKIFSTLLSVLPALLEVFQWPFMIILICENLNGSNHLRSRYMISQKSSHIYTRRKMLLGTYNTRPLVVVVGFMDYSISKIYCHYCLTSIDSFQV